MRPLLLAIVSVGLATGCGSPNALPMKAGLSDASLTLGPGRLPGGSETPAPSNFRPTLSALLSLVPAYKGKDLPELKIWSVPDEAERAFVNGVQPEGDSLGGRQLKVLSQNFLGQGALMQFEVLWEGPAEGRFLVVEVWQEGRRAAAAAARIEIHYLPATQPRGREGER